MKKNTFITILLIFLSILISCSDHKNQKEDYYQNAVRAYENGDEKSAKDNILLFMLTYNELTQIDLRDDAVRLYTAIGFPDALNTVVLSNNDVLEGRITLYKSYAALGQNQKATDILENTIHGYLSVADYATLVINYPTDSLYTANILKQWLSNLKDEDKDYFLELTDNVARSELSEDAAKTVFEVCNGLLEDSYYLTDRIKLNVLYKSTAIILEKLYDNYNAKRYWRQAYYLNPQDTEVGAHL